MTRLRVVDTTPCQIDSCFKPARSRGWCWMHYGRWRRHGDPNAAPAPHLPPPAWADPLTDDDYRALQASVEADARKLLPLVAHYIVFQQLVTGT